MQHRVIFIMTHINEGFMLYFRFFLAIPFLLIAHLNARNATNIPPIPAQADYVIVGVGTAGAAMAKKLSDNFSTSVVAIHNGPNLTEDPLIKYTRNTKLTL